MVSLDGGGCLGAMSGSEMHLEYRRGVLSRRCGVSEEGKVAPDFVAELYMYVADEED